MDISLGLPRTPRMVVSALCIVEVAKRIAGISNMGNAKDPGSDATIWLDLKQQWGGRCGVYTPGRSSDRVAKL